MAYEDLGAIAAPKPAAQPYADLGAIPSAKAEVKPDYADLGAIPATQQPEEETPDPTKAPDYSPARHAAEDPNAFETAFAARKARKARSIGEKAGAFAGTLATPQTWIQAGKGVIDFLTGIPSAIANPAQQAYYRATDDPRARTKQAEAVLSGQTAEVSGKHLFDSTIGKIASGASKLDDPNPSRTAWRKSFLRRNPGAAEKYKAAWEAEDKADREEQADQIEREEFRREIARERESLQLQQGKPLDTGMVAGIFRGAHGEEPSDVVSPEALTGIQAPQADPAAIARNAAALDPSNLALAMAPSLPGAKFIGGAATELTGKALKVPMAIAEAMPGRVGQMARTGAGMGWGQTLLTNPALAAQIAAGVVGAKGLQVFGRVLEAQGKELRTGIPSALTDTVAKARLTGNVAKLASIGRTIGDTAAHGSTTAVGMLPLNFALAGGDPEEMAHLTAGAAAFGGTLGAFTASRPMLLEAVRPHLRAQGEASIDLNNPVAAKSKAFLDSMPEEARNGVLEIMGALQGLDAGNGKTAQLHVLSARDYLAELARVAAATGSPTPTGDAGRGFFYGADGAAYVNGQHPQNARGELIHTVGHEFGGHAGLAILQAAGAKGGPIYNALMKEARKSLMPNGKPSNELVNFINEYNRSFGKKVYDPRNPDSMEEFIAEQAGQLIASEGMANLALPKSILDKVESAVVRGLSAVIGIDTRLIGTRTKFAREEIGAVTEAVRDTLTEIAGMKRTQPPVAAPAAAAAGTPPKPATPGTPPPAPGGPAASSASTQAPGANLNRFKIAAILRRDFGLSQDEAKQWADVGNGADEVAAAMDALKQRAEKKFPTQTPQPAGTAPEGAQATATAVKAPPMPKGTPEVLAAVQATHGTGQIAVSGQQLRLRGEPAPGVTWKELIDEGHYTMLRGYGDSFTLTPAKPNEQTTPPASEPIPEGATPPVAKSQPDATPVDPAVPETPDTQVPTGDALKIVPLGTTGTFVIHDAAGNPINSRTYVSEKSAQAAIRQMERGGTFRLAPNPTPEAPDIIDQILEAGGIDFSKLSPEEAAVLVPDKYLRTLLAGDNAPDEIARQLAPSPEKEQIGEPSFGDGDIWTLPGLIEAAYDARRNAKGSEKAEKAAEREQEAQAKQEMARMTQHANEIAAGAEKAAREIIAATVAVRPAGLKLTTKEGKAWKAEQGGKEILTTEEVEQRVRTAKMRALLDYIGTDEYGIQRSEDTYGNESITGNFDPDNPYHVALAKLGGNSKAIQERIADMQEGYGRVRFMLYRSAEKKGIAGEGGEGSVEEFTTGNRRKDYAEQPAQERAQGKHDGTPQKWAIIPVETILTTKSGKLQFRVFVLDNLLHNAESVFTFMRGKGMPNPYGEHYAEQEPLLIRDAQAYAQNHANGWRGDGSAPIAQFPDSGLPTPVAGYIPKTIPKERFDLLNMLFHDERASKTSEVTDKIDRLEEEGKPVPPRDRAQLDAANEILRLAAENKRAIDPSSGETNPFRKALKEAGFDTKENLENIVRTLEPENVLEYDTQPIEGEYQSVRPTGFSIPAQELGKEGRPNPKAVAANFMPAESAGAEERPAAIQKRALKLWATKGVKSPFFKKWQGDAELFRMGDDLHDIQPGNPVVIEGVHGTTHDYGIADPSKGNIENDFGKAWYVSNTHEDVSGNYAGEGPDLTARIERLDDYLSSVAENPMTEDAIKELTREYGATEEQAQKIIDGDDAAKRELARKNLTTHGGATMKVFVKLENPLKLGGREEYWDSTFDEDTGEASGKMADFATALRNEASRYDEADSGEWSRIDEMLFEGGSVSEAIAAAREAVLYATDENGDLASNEIIRATIERMGYDGILDGTVNEKFGSARKIGEQMQGMDENTFHILAFRPEQIKSATGNQGTFDASNPDMRFMPGESESADTDHSAGKKPLRQSLLSTGWWAYPKPRGELTKEKIIRALKQVQNPPVSTRLLAKFVNHYDSAQDLFDHTYYHGTGGYVSGTAKPSITFSDRTVEQNGGGGYGEKYWAISLSKAKRTAEAFSGQSGSVSIHPVLLKKGAKVIEMPEIQDAADIEDHIIDLWKKQVDAVWIGGGEQELAVINPKAIVFAKDTDTYRVFGGFKSENFTLERAEQVREQAKAILETYGNEYHQKMSFMPGEKEETHTVKIGGVNMTPKPGILFLPAHHGTPHKIDPEEGFKLEKIGTGEGAQAYGWGLYFAENPKVGKEYQKQLAGQDTSIPPVRKFRGEKLTPGSPEYHAATLIASTGYTLAGVKKEVRGWIENAKPEENVEHYKKVLETLERATSKKDFKEENDPGNFYTVEIDLKDHEILAWDKPLAEQPDAIKELIREMLKEQKYLAPNDNGPRVLQSAWRAWRNEHGGFAEGDNGGALYAGLEKKLGSAEAASKALLERGIAGIKYKDEGSRGKRGGTYNFVVFDASRIEITHENGEPITRKERTALLAQNEGQKPPDFMPSERTPQQRAQDRERDRAIKDKTVPFDANSLYMGGNKRIEDRMQPGVWLTRSGDVIPIDTDHHAAAKELLGIETEDPNAAMQAAYARGWVRATIRTYGDKAVALSGPKLTPSQKRNLKEWSEIHGYGIEDYTNRWSNGQLFMPSEARDREYLAAVESGDMEAAQRHVDEAAKAAGYTTEAFHGTGTQKFTVFRDWLPNFFTPQKEYAAGYVGGKKTKTGKIMKLALSVQNPFDTRIDAHRKIFNEEFLPWVREKGWQKDRFGEGAELKEGELLPFTKADTVYPFLRAMKREGKADFDGYLVDERFGDYSPSIVPLSPSQIKSADPITRDDQGRVIPLSERFNPATGDIRFMPSEEKRPDFYSGLSRVIEAKMPNAAPAAQAKAIARGGGKAEELKWSGIEQAIDRLAEENGGKVTKAQVLDHLAKDGALQIQEVKLSDRQKEPVESIDELPYELAYIVKEYRDHGGDKWSVENKANSKGYEIVWDGDRIESILEPKPKNAAKFGQYQLPGGENYREVVLTMPDASVESRRYKIAARKLHDLNAEMDRMEKAGVTEESPEWQAINAEYAKAEKIRDAYIPQTEQQRFTSSHFPDADNYVAHMRLNDRTDAEGRPGTLLEELQSDRHQQGRERGYKGDGLPPKWKIEKLTDDHFVLKDEAGNVQSNYFPIEEHRGSEDYARRFFERDHAEGVIPDAPFRKDWPLQLFKRALRDAVASGKEWIGWTTGETQAERYDLSKQIGEVKYEPEDEGDFSAGTLYAYDLNGKIVMNERGVEPHQLADYIGKEPAQKLIDQITEKESNVSQWEAAKDEETGDWNLYDANGEILHDYSGDVERFQSKERALQHARGLEFDSNRQEPIRLRGLDLKVGGEGMKGFYDNILPKEVGKYVKQWGTSVEKGKLPAHKPTSGNDVIEFAGLTREMWNDLSEPQRREIREDFAKEQSSKEIWRVNITPEMAESVKEGQPMFMPSTLKEDMQQQTEWMHQQAKERGYNSLNNFIATEPGEFNKLAAQWRLKNAREKEDGTLKYMPSEEPGTGSEEFKPSTPREKAIARNAERAGSLYQGESQGLHAFKELDTNGNFSIKGDELSPEAIQEKADAVRESFKGKKEVTTDNLAQWLKEQGFTDEEGKPKFMPAEDTTTGGEVIRANYAPDDTLIMHSPHSGDDVEVSFRGPHEGKAVVWTGRSQMAVPFEWLRRKPGYQPPKKPDDFKSIFQAEKAGQGEEYKADREAFDKAYAEWLESIPKNQPLVFHKTANYGEKEIHWYSAVTRDPSGDWRVTHFDPTLEMPSGHQEHKTRLDAANEVIGWERIEDLPFTVKAGEYHAQRTPHLILKQEGKESRLVKFGGYLAGGETAVVMDMKDIFGNWEDVHADDLSRPSKEEAEKARASEREQYRKYDERLEARKAREEETGQKEFRFMPMEAHPLKGTDLAQIPDDQLLSEKEYRKSLWGAYFDEEGNRKTDKRGKELTSKNTPQSQLTYKVGQWRVSDMKLNHGREVEQLRILDPRKLVRTEDLVENNTEGRGYDSEQYGKWWDEGKTPPPIEVIEADNGDWKVVDGHRRHMAALKANRPILAWFNPNMAHPKGAIASNTGKVQRVGMTLEGVRAAGSEENARGEAAERKPTPLEGTRQTPKEAAHTRQRDREHSIDLGGSKMTAGPQMLFLPAHHGTPHEIDPREGFRLEKIGTGEGAQAYGWGLYFAENPKVAGEYRKTLSNPTGDPVVDGKRFKGDGMDGMTYSGIRTLAEHHGDAEKAIQSVIDKANEYGIPLTDKSVTRRIETIREYAGRVQHEDTLGNLYTVDIDAPHEDFLDWDAPLDEQSPSVQQKLGIPQIDFAALKEARRIQAEFLDTMAGKEPTPEDIAKGEELDNAVWAIQKPHDDAIRDLLERFNDGNWGTKGSDIYEKIGYKLNPGIDGGIRTKDAPRATSEYLASLGIPGIRYHDQGSRPKGSPTAIRENIQTAKAKLKQWQQTPPENRGAAIAREQIAMYEKEIATLEKNLAEAEENPATYNFVVFDPSLIRITHKNGEEITAEQAAKDAEGESTD